MKTSLDEKSNAKAQKNGNTIGRIILACLCSGIGWLFVMGIFALADFIEAKITHGSIAHTNFLGGVIGYFILITYVIIICLYQQYVVEPIKRRKKEEKLRENKTDNK